jgi:hypothetical protein
MHSEAARTAAEMSGLAAFKAIARRSAATAPASAGRAPIRTSYSSDTSNAVTRAQAARTVAEVPGLATLEARARRRAATAAPAAAADPEAARALRTRAAGVAVRAR